MSGCYNHPPYQTLIPVQDGWYMDGYTRTPRMVAIPFTMTKPCQYTLSELGKVDRGCDGCTWRQP